MVDCCVKCAGTAREFPVQIKLVEPLGSDTLIHFEIAATPAIARVDPSLKPSQASDCSCCRSQTRFTCSTP
jgi:hypothetical protein